MAGIQRKSLSTPDERETFPLGRSDEVHLGEMVVARTHHEPGWRWSTHVKPIVGTPTCQFHHTGVVLSGRLRVRLDDGTEAEIGPNDVFDVIPGHDAWVVGDEPFQTIDWIGAHRWASPPSGQRILATILFTDIVDSTALAERFGDEEWTRKLEEHHAVLRRVLDRYRGREVGTTGDGILAVFDGAERGILAALALGPALAPIGLKVRAGLHCGEVEMVPGNVRGVAVHVAARVMALAVPDEILVSETVRGLVESPRISFADRGEFELKGVTGARRLFAVAPQGSNDR